MHGHNLEGQHKERIDGTVIKICPTRFHNEFGFIVVRIPSNTQQYNITITAPLPFYFILILLRCKASYTPS
jgi:hypothetical protein